MFQQPNLNTNNILKNFLGFFKTYHVSIFDVGIVYYKVKEVIT